MKPRCYFIGAPGGGGAIATHFLALGEELVGRGNDVKIISHSAPGNGVGRKARASMIEWPSPRPTRFADALFLVRLIRQYHPDCLLANFAAVNWMCLVGWLSRVSHRIAFYHTLKSQTQSDGSVRLERPNFASIFRKRLVYRAATCVAGISQAALLDAQNTFGVAAGKCRLWRYSMPDPAPRFRLKSAAERENLVVCPGRLFPSKGQDVLIAALALLPSTMVKPRVDFLGDGPMLERLRQLAEQQGVASQCRFVGLVPHEEVLERMSRARVTVVPSRHEAFGLVNIESLSVGTPVIASRVDGIREIIRDGTDGYLVPSEAPGALSQKLASVLADSPLREELGRNARRHFLAEYENSLVVRRQADQLETAVRSGHWPALQESDV